MKTVCVITGGGSGMGLAAAKCMPKEKIIVISGRTVAKLEKAVEELKELGFEAYAYACDTSNRASVKELAEKETRIIKTKEQLFGIEKYDIILLINRKEELYEE